MIAGQFYFCAKLRLIKSVLLYFSKPSQTLRLVISVLTLMLLTAKFANTKLCKNPEKPLKPLANGYSSESAQQELSNEYQHDRVLMFLKNLCILVLWAKVATALEGLIHT